MQIYLKIKVKTLAAEAQMIRKEERKIKTSKNRRRAAKRAMKLGVKQSDGSFMQLSNMERDHAVKVAQKPSDEALDIFEGLHSHRTGPLREEARLTHIAYGFLRGFAYEQIEANAKKRPNWDRVMSMVTKYGTKPDWDRYKEWHNNAIKYRDSLAKN